MEGSQQGRPRLIDDEFDFNAADLTSQFEQLLRNSRLNALEEHARTPRTASPGVTPRASHRTASHTSLSPRALSAAPNTSSQPSRPQPAGQLTYHHQYSYHPIIPSPPQDAGSYKFRNLLMMLSQYPVKYENPGLLDRALTHVPLSQIYQEAEEEHSLILALAASTGEKAKWGYQDCVIKSLLRWFKRSFFSFVHNPACSRCNGPSASSGNTPPTPDEQALGASKVELYQCQNPACGAYERFPRYTDVWTLLETRKGRAGEFANVFCMLCRAAGARVRWVWNSEDHVWTEVYSEHQRRWVHVDACEETWDVPRMYTEGWGKKMAYCIAFSIEGATDVTRRYVRNPAHALGRTRCAEEVLLFIIHEIRKMRRENMDKPVQNRLRHEDEREERELRRYVAHSLTAEMMNEMTVAANAGGDRAKTAAEVVEPERPQWSNQQNGR
ncbi:hypothetical protein DV736_g4537, partial [Chaetothyriales sp. CBS 134916]